MPSDAHSKACHPQPSLHISSAQSRVKRRQNQAGRKNKGTSLRINNTAAVAAAPGKKSCAHQTETIFAFEQLGRRRRLSLFLLRTRNPSN